MRRNRERPGPSANQPDDPSNPLTKAPLRPRATGAVVLIVFAMLTVVAALIFFAGFALIVL
jgi:hypothetical protein